MNIHEHQAKQILRKFGIKVPNGVIGFTVDDIESEITRLTKAGAKLMEGPIDVPNGSMRICFLATPGDVRIELLEILS